MGAESVSSTTTLVCRSPISKPAHTKRVCAALKTTTNSMEGIDDLLFFLRGIDDLLSLHNDDNYLAQNLEQRTFKIGIAGHPYKEKEP